MNPGFTADGLRRWRAAAERHVSDELVPGLVSLMARGDEVHVHALGTLAIGGRPVARDSIFRIASTSKPITAAATPSRELTIIGADAAPVRYAAAAPVHSEIQAAAYAALA